MANHEINPFGTDGQLPSSIGVINDLTTGGADKALSAGMGKYIGEHFIQSDDQSGYDFAVEDENGHIVFAIKNGHIVTKNFDSRHIEADTSSGESFNRYAEPVPCLPIDNTKPQHLGQVNVIRKALQLCNVKWTPVRDTMPSCGGGSNSQIVGGRAFFKANVENTGIPYSSTGFDGKAIGSDITLETFMTAVKNPNSVLYTIDLRDTLSSNLVGAYYGNNCSSFTNVVQGIYCIVKGRNNNFAGNKIIEFPKTAEALQIGDVIYLSNAAVDSGHTVVVIGIEKDANGFITNITEAEEDGEKARIYTYTKDQFETRFFKGGGYAYGWIYRNTNLFDNLDFKQEFVGVYDQSGDIPYTYSETIGINIGNNSNFNKSDSMPIEVSFLDVNTANSFTLYKGTTSLGVYNASSGTAGYGSTKIVTINKADLDAGTYEVRPSSGVSQYFCVAVPGTVTKTYDEQDNLVVETTGHSSNVQPYGVVLISNRSSRTTRGLWLMNGENSVTIPKMWLDYINTTNDIAYLKVVYRNEYGNIYSNDVAL